MGSSGDSAHGTGGSIRDEERKVKREENRDSGGFQRTGQIRSSPKHSSSSFRPHGSCRHEFRLNGRGGGRMLPRPPRGIFSSPNAFLLSLLASKPTLKDPAIPSKFSLVKTASTGLSTPVRISLWHLIIYNMTLNSTRSSPTILF